MESLKLAESVTIFGKWLGGFTEKRYPEAFSEFCGLYEKAFADALEAEGAEKVADAFMGGIEADLQKTFFLRRSGERANIKMTIIAYLCPMLLRMEKASAAETLTAETTSEAPAAEPEKNPLAQELCDLLCDRWNEAYPKDCVRGAVSYETINGSFCHKLFGLDLSVTDRR